MMDDELKCPACKQFVTNPVLLPCSHSYCLQVGHMHSHSCVIVFSQCVHRHQQPAHTFEREHGGCKHDTAPSMPSCSHTSGSDTMSIDTESDDKVSVLSESDSGVICSSRPSSYIGGAHAGGTVTNSLFPRILTPAGGILSTPTLIHNHHHHVQQFSPQSTATASAGNNSSYCLQCLTCHKTHYFADDQAVNYLPKNRALANVVTRYQHCRSGQSTPTQSLSLLSLTPVSPTMNDMASTQACQLCEHVQPPPAAVSYCEQCEIFYCDTCQQNCHPRRGPLIKHRLVPAAQVRRSRAVTRMQTRYRHVGRGSRRASSP
jgi:tripartite motif-containing protein 9/67